MSPPPPPATEAPPKKRGLFSRKPAPTAAPAPQISAPTPTSSWPTSPSPPLPSDSQGVFPAHRHSSVGHVDWNSVGVHMTGGGPSNGAGHPGSSPSLSTRVSEDGRKISTDGGDRPRASTLGRSSSGQSAGEGGKSGGVRSFFGRNKRATMPAQTRESGAPSGIPVPVKKSEMTRSQSSNQVGAGNGRQDESPFSQSSPALNVTPASPTHPRIRAHHEQQAALNGSPRSPLSPTSAPIPFSPASSQFSRPLGVDDARSVHSTTTTHSTKSAPFSPALSSIAPPFPTSPLPRAASNVPANPAQGNTLPGARTVAAPFRVRVFIDHPTTEPLYITVIPGEETLRTLKHKILKVDNDRFVQFRQARRPPVETRWDIHPNPSDERVPGDKTFDLERRIQLFRVSVDWLVVSKTKRNYEKTRTFISILSSAPSTPILPSAEDDVLPLLQLFPATEASAAARLKGLIEIVVRVTPERESVPVMVSFSDMPDQPVVVDVEQGASVREVKESIAKARGLAVRTVGGGRAGELEAHDFFLFKCAQPRHTTEPLPYDIDQFDGLAPESLFDDENMQFASQPYVMASGLQLPERQLRSVELVAFLSSDMEDEFRDSLIMKSHIGNETDDEVDNGLSPAANIMNKARGVPTGPAHVQGHPSRPDNARNNSRSTVSSNASAGRNSGYSSHNQRSQDSSARHEQARQQHNEREQARQQHHQRQEQVKHQQQQQQQQAQFQHQNQQNEQTRVFQNQQLEQRQQYEREASEQTQRMQQSQPQSPPVTPSAGSFRLNGSSINGSSTHGSNNGGTSSYASSIRNSPPRAPHQTMNADAASVASPSSYRTARNGETDPHEGMISPRLVSNVSSHQRNSDLDPLEHAPTDSGLEDVLRNYTSSDGSAGSLVLSEAGGIEGLKSMLEKARVSSIEEDNEDEEEMTFGEPADSHPIGEMWGKNPGGLSTLGEEDEETASPPAKGDFHSRLLSPKSATSPLLLVHIRKPYAGPITDATSHVEDISPTSHSIPLPPVAPPPPTFAASGPSPRSSNASTASSSSATSTSSFSAGGGPSSSRTGSNASSVYSRASYAQEIDPMDRTGSTDSPVGSERTIIPNGLGSRNDSITSSTTSDKTVTVLPSPVEQRFRFASMGSLAQHGPPAVPSSPTRPKYAHSMAVPRRGSRRDSSYGVKSANTGYPLPLRSALKGGKAQAKASRPAPAPSTRRPVRARGVNANGGGNRNSWLLAGGGGGSNRNSYLGGNGSTSGGGGGSNRNSLLLNTRFIPSAGRLSGKTSNSSLHTHGPSSPGLHSPSFNTLRRKPSPPQGQSQQQYRAGSSTDSYTDASESDSYPSQSREVDLSRSSPPGSVRHGSGSSGGRGQGAEQAGETAQGYAVIGGAMFSVTLRPMDEKGAQIMKTQQFKSAGPMYKLEAY